MIFLLSPYLESDNFRFYTCEIPSGIQLYCTNCEHRLVNLSESVNTSAWDILWKVIPFWSYCPCMYCHEGYLDSKFFKAKLEIIVGVGFCLPCLCSNCLGWGFSILSASLSFPQIFLWIPWSQLHLSIVMGYKSISRSKLIWCIWLCGLSSFQPP